MVHADVMVKKFFCSWWVLDWGWRDWVFLLFCLKWISTNKEIINKINSRKYQNLITFPT